jgi:hypothetical protein
MLILARLISRSSRSLAAMIGFVRAGGGRRRGGWSGSPDRDVSVALPSLPLFSYRFKPQLSASGGPVPTLSYFLP